MSGHSRFKKIKHKKEAEDANRSKAFSKALRQISIAVQQGGSDPKINTKLRLAMLQAKAVNLPKSKMEDAIKKASSSVSADQLTEIRYEGFIQSTIAFVMEVLTPNIKRTWAELKNILGRNQVMIGEPGCVSHMFDNLGFIVYSNSVKQEDEMVDLALEAGADDCQLVENDYEITTEYGKLHSVREFLEGVIGEPNSAKHVWRPKYYVTENHGKMTSVLNLIDEIEEQEDVQAVYTNLDYPDDYVRPED